MLSEPSIIFYQSSFTSQQNKTKLFTTKMFFETVYSRSKVSFESYNKKACILLVRVWENKDKVLMGFRQITSYLPEGFRQITSYLPEGFRQITSS